MRVRIEMYISFLLVMFSEVNLEDIEITTILSEGGNENIFKEFHFVNKEFDGKISDGWRQLLLDIKKDANSVPQNSTNISESVMPEVSGGTKIIKNTPIAGAGTLKIQHPDAGLRGAKSGESCHPR